MSLIHEIWAGYRPYLIKFAVNFAVSGTLWVGLFVFHGLTKFLPVTDWAGRFIVHMHSAGIVAAFATFAILSAVDIVHIRGGGGLCFA
jgi:hypothetical protein